MVRLSLLLALGIRRLDTLLRPSPRVPTRLYALVGSVLKVNYFGDGPE